MLTGMLDIYIVFIRKKSIINIIEFFSNTQKGLQPTMYWQESLYWIMKNYPE